MNICRHVPFYGKSTIGNEMRLEQWTCYMNKTQAMDLLHEWDSSNWLITWMRLKQWTWYMNETWAMDSLHKWNSSNRLTTWMRLGQWTGYMNETWAMDLLHEWDASNWLYWKINLLQRIKHEQSKSTITFSLRCMNISEAMIYMKPMRSPNCFYATEKECDTTLFLKHHVIELFSINVTLTVRLPF